MKSAYSEGDYGLLYYEEWLYLKLVNYCEKSRATRKCAIPLGHIANDCWQWHPVEDWLVLRGMVHRELGLTELVLEGAGTKGAGTKRLGLRPPTLFPADAELHKPDKKGIGKFRAKATKPHTESYLYKTGNSLS